MLFEGEAEWVSSENTEGPFDILYMHANFVTLIENKPIKIKLRDGKVQEFAYKQSVVYAHNNVVSIYTNL